MNHFQPSIARARGLRWALDEALWTSARDMLDELGEDIPPPAPVETRACPTHLLDFAAYFDLDQCMRPDLRTPPERKDRAVAHLAGRLSAAVPLAPEAAPPRISNFDPTFYTPEQLDRMSRWWDAEPANRMALSRASDAEYTRSLREIDKALDYLRQAAPEIHGELEFVIRDVVLAKPDGTNLINYSGASSFGLWGAITINAETQCEWIQFYRQLVHELGHNLLFAIARDTPLVKADPSVRRPSPIRADPRPLDGIFHAAFVSAREAVALEQLLSWHEDGGELAGDDAEIIADTLELSVLAFWECLETLRGDEQGPTEFGEAVLADCEAYMAANFALEPC
jgi:HEXXH motif-containing protein